MHRKQKKFKTNTTPNLFTLEQFNENLYNDILERIKNNDITIDELQQLIVYYTGMFASHKELVRNQLYVFQDGIDPLTNSPLNDFDCHHIVKNECGGTYSFENGVLLNKPTHRFLHNEIELYGPDIFELLTDCLLLYKDVKALQNEKLLDQWNEEVSSEYQKCMTLKRYR